MSTEDLKPFTVSEGEGLSESDREYMKTGKVPEGFAPSEDPPSADDVVVKVPGEDPPPPPADDDDEGDDTEVAVKVRDAKTGQFQRMVPHRALHGEREEHKKTKADLATMREQHLVGSTRLKTLFEMAGVDPDTLKPTGKPQSQANPLEEKTIAFTEDPIKAFEQMERRQAYVIAQLSERGKTVDGLNQRLENQSEAEATKAWVQEDFRAFVGKEPTFGMAYNHLIEAIKQELLIGGTPEAEINQEIEQRQRDFLRSARAQNKSAADMIFKLAQVKGFKKPEIMIGKDGKPTLKQKGPAAGTQAAAEQLTNIKKGQEASASLSKSGGGATEELTLARLATMDEDSYAAIRKKLGKDGMKQYLGA